MQMYYYCDVTACFIHGYRIMHTVTWLFLGYGFLMMRQINTNDLLKYSFIFVDWQTPFQFTTGITTTAEAFTSTVPEVSVTSELTQTTSGQVEETTSIVTPQETSVSSISQASTTQEPLVSTVTFLTLEEGASTQRVETTSIGATESTVLSTAETTALSGATSGKSFIC